MNQSRVCEVLPYLSGRIRYSMERLTQNLWLDVEEVRLRSDSPLTIGVRGENCFVTPDGRVSNYKKDALHISHEEVQSAFMAICQNSVYAHLEEIRQGFLTLNGGHRVGICGKIVAEDGKIKTFREVSSLNFRIAHEIHGVADDVIDSVVCGNRIKNTMIISPPQMGKTTMLRDLTRQISNRGFKIGVADDRGELGAMYQGSIQNDLGAQTDVIDNAPKAEAILMLLRTMSPKVIVSDEISRAEDVSAIQLAHGTGVSVIATVHGRSLDEVKQRAVLEPIFRDGIFEQMILLHRRYSSAEPEIRIRAVSL